MNLLNYRSSKGVTLISLIITIIVLIILAGISIQYGMSTIHDVNNNKTNSELSIVQSAIVQRYTLAKSKQELIPIMQSKYEISQASRTSSGLDRVLVGTIVDDVLLLESNGFWDHKINYGPGRTNLVTNINYESLYYLLEQDDLVDLGIVKDIEDDTNQSYVVNYATGEVFDFENKRYYPTYDYYDSPIYIPSSNPVITNNNQNDIYIDE